MENKMKKSTDSSFQKTFNYQFGNIAHGFVGGYIIRTYVDVSTYLLGSISYRKLVLGLWVSFIAR